MKEKTKRIINQLFENYVELIYLEEEIYSTICNIISRINNGAKIYICGNGGSAADSEHIVGELVKEFYIKRPLNESFKTKLNSLYDGETSELITNSLQEGVKAYSLVSQTALSTAFSNDVLPEMVFGQQVYVYGEEGDILIGLSTSGNSKNVVLAFQVAKAKNMLTIALTGEDGGKLKSFADNLINVPSDETFRIQEYHLPIYHVICRALENELYGG